MIGFRMLCAWAAGVIPNPTPSRRIMVLKKSSPFHISISARPGYKVLMSPNKTDGLQGHYFFVRDPADTTYLCPWVATLPEKKRGKPLPVDDWPLKMITHFQPSYGLPDTLTSFSPMLCHFYFHDNDTHPLTRADLDLRMKRMFRGNKHVTRPFEQEPGFQSSDFQRPLAADSGKKSSEEVVAKSKSSKKPSGVIRPWSGVRIEDSALLPPPSSALVVASSSPPLITVGNQARVRSGKQKFYMKNTIYIHINTFRRLSN
ncbi:hypothetical protein ABFS83_06G137700 [Erythranthe nasuta]